MNNVFKQSGQNSTTTGASLLISNQSLMKKTHGQNNLSYIPLNILNKLTDSLKKKKENCNTCKHRVKKHFFHRMNYEKNSIYCYFSYLPYFYS